MDAFIHNFIEEHCLKGNILISNEIKKIEQVFNTLNNAGIEMEYIPEIVRYVILLSPSPKLYRIEPSRLRNIFPSFILLNPPKVFKYPNKPLPRQEYEEKKDMLLYEAMSELAMRYLQEHNPCATDALMAYLQSSDKKIGFDNADFRSYMQSKYPFVRMGLDECRITTSAPRQLLEYDLVISDPQEPPSWTMALKDGTWYLITEDTNVSVIINTHMPILFSILQSDTTRAKIFNA